MPYRQQKCILGTLIHLYVTHPVSSQKIKMIGQCTLPLLVLASFFLNFATMESPARMSDKYTTLITPPRIAFWVWVPIYAMQALYVFYQILSSKARNSKLVQNKISILFIFHQILIAAWLNLFNHDHIYPATAIIICAWALTLFIFGCITIEFRTGKYPKYTVRDFICIEIPFALLLGWETLATAISISIFIVRLYYDNFTSLNTTAALQMTAVIVTFALITLIAILFAGLPAVSTSNASTLFTADGSLRPPTHHLGPFYHWMEMAQTRSSTYRQNSPKLGNPCSLPSCQLCCLDRRIRHYCVFRHSSRHHRILETVCRRSRFRI